MNRETSLMDAITREINRHSAENASMTPDFILGRYLTGCLELFNRTMQARAAWYGKDPESKDSPIVNLTGEL